MTDLAHPAASKRIYSYDVIRVIAILAVVLIHAATNFVSRYPAGGTAFAVGNLADSIAHLGVPLFVMLSGALMLNEEREVSAGQMIRAAIRILVLLYIWSFFYAAGYRILYPLLTHRAVSLREFASAFVFGHYHMWYLFMLVGLYLITPILRAFVKKKNADLVLYFILLSVLFRFLIPPLSALLNRFTSFGDILTAYADTYEMGFVSPYAAYYLLGWYMTNVEIPKAARRWIYVLGGAGLLFTVLGSQFLTTYTQRVFEVFYSCKSLNIFAYSAAAFLFLNRRLSENESPRFAGSFAALAKRTFGVYLLHPLLLKLAEKFAFTSNVFIRIPLDWAVATVGSFLIVFLLSKIPLLKKLVRC